VAKENEVREERIEKAKETIRHLRGFLPSDDVMADQAEAEALKALELATQSDHQLYCDEEQCNCPTETTR
jgi:hypothetical protein